MNIEELQQLCTSFPGVIQDIKWESHLCFNVSDKLFMITSPDELPVSASFKVSEEDFLKLSERAGCEPAPYLARYKWIRIEDISLFSKSEWEYYAYNAYKLISLKLSKKKREELGISD